eukprot:11600796-Alexandrium_andersonii.AAC.1
MGNTARARLAGWEARREDGTPSSPLALFFLVLASTASNSTSDGQEHGSKTWLDIGVGHMCNAT